MNLHVVIEGDTDIPVARKIARLAGWEGECTFDSRRGKYNLDPFLPKWNEAAKYSETPWLVLRDLDNDKPCAGELRAKLLPEPARFLCLRIPVKSIESWLLADADTLSIFLHVSRASIPTMPDMEEDPKGTLVDIARRSTKPRVVRDMVPGRGVSRRTGAGYEGCIIDYGANHGRPDIARHASPSLDRAIHALTRLRDFCIREA